MRCSTSPSTKAPSMRWSKTGGRSRPMAASSTSQPRRRTSFWARR
ncbi:MAG: hypothetical protein LBF91_03400 [Azoarcus sp.]|nr:hypothetical protein [Azoarcus sp.]